MMITIVYTSETGHTQRYATMLGELCRKPVMTLEEAKEKLEKGSKIVYLGWVMAGRVVGLKQARKKFQILAVAGVGIRPDVDNMTKTICNMTGVPSDGGFYLPGGYNPETLEPTKKKALTMVLGVLSKKIRKKETLNPSEKRLLQVFEHGGSFVEKQYITQLKNYVKKLGSD